MYNNPSTANQGLDPTVQQQQGGLPSSTLRTGGLNNRRRNLFASTSGNANQPLQNINSQQQQQNERLSNNGNNLVLRELTEDQRQEIREAVGNLNRQWVDYDNWKLFGEAYYAFVRVYYIYIYICASFHTHGGFPIYTIHTSFLRSLILYYMRLNTNHFELLNFLNFCARFFPISLTSLTMTMTTISIIMN